MTAYELCARLGHPPQGNVEVGQDCKCLCGFRKYTRGPD